ncbi:MAG: hypothetical protein WD648_06205 [Planctomycetaceae bacterium]
MKIQTFPFRKRRHIAVAFTLVVASVVVGCTRAQGTFPDLWGPDRLTFKDAAGKVAGLVRTDKKDDDADSKGRVRMVGVIDPGRAQLSDGKPERVGASLLGQDAGRARITADNASNPFIALGQEDSGRVALATSSNVQTQQQQRVVTADVQPDAGVSKVARKSDNFVAQQAPPKGQFVETFNSQMDRLRAEMKVNSGQPEVSDRRQRGFAVEFPEIPKFDESVALNEAIDLAEPLKAPELSATKPSPTYQPQPSFDPSVQSQTPQLPVITPRRPVQRSSQQSANNATRTVSNHGSNPTPSERVPAEPTGPVTSTADTTVQVTVPLPSTTWDPAPPQPVVSVATQPAPPADSAKRRPVDPRELVVSTKNVLTRDEIRRGQFEQTRNAANFPIAIQVPAASPSPSESPASVDLAIPSARGMDEQGHGAVAGPNRSMVVTADGSIEIPQPLPTGPLLAQAVPVTRVPASISGKGGPSFLSKVPKSPVATTALDAVHWDAEPSDEAETSSDGGFPKWPVPVGIAIASLFFVFARRRVRAEE